MLTEIKELKKNLNEIYLSLISYMKNKDSIDLEDLSFKINKVCNDIKKSEDYGYKPIIKYKRKY